MIGCPAICDAARAAGTLTPRDFHYPMRRRVRYRRSVGRAAQRTFWRLNRQRYEFHNVELSSITKSQPPCPRRGRAQTTVPGDRVAKADVQALSKPSPSRSGSRAPTPTLAAATSTRRNARIAPSERPSTISALDWMLRRVKTLLLRVSASIPTPSLAITIGPLLCPICGARAAPADLQVCGRSRNACLPTYARRPRWWLAREQPCAPIATPTRSRRWSTSRVLAGLAMACRVGWFQKTRTGRGTCSRCLKDIQETYGPPPAGTQQIARDMLIVDWSGCPLKPGCRRDKRLATRGNSAMRKCAQSARRRRLARISLPARWINHASRGIAAHHLRRTAAP